MAATGAAAIPAVAAAAIAVGTTMSLPPCPSSQDYIIVRDCALCATYHHFHIPYIPNDNTAFTTLVRLYIPIITC